jgi:DNA-binding LacI/PurR family transcriptional regulator
MKILASKTTLSTIADHLGVSTATVSLALRDSPLVADATRERIKKSAVELGYIYNRRAASLRTSRSGIIGVLVHDIMNPFFAEILKAIEEELGSARRTFLLCNHHDSIDIQTNFIETLLQFGADGVILSPAIGTSAHNVAAIEASGLPVVLIARWIEGVHAPLFRGDDRHGIVLATRHLIGLGHKKIAYVGGKRQTSTGRDRRDGFREAMHEAGLEPDPAWQAGSDSTRKSGYDTLRSMFAAGIRPSGIVCFNDLVAIGVMSGLRSLGLEPGIDVSVTGYDDIAEAEIASPALTTVWNGQQEVGRKAARAMIDLISGREVSREMMLIAPELRVRESTGSPKP